VLREIVEGKNRSIKEQEQWRMRPKMRVQAKIKNIKDTSR